MDYIKFFINNKRIISFGFLLTFFSSFGQTFLLSLYVPDIINTYQLTNSAFGSMYALATIASAFFLAYLGKLIDNYDLRNYTLFAALLLLASCIIFAFSFHVSMILLALFGLRLSGQGLLSHISQISIAKIFIDKRGKALSISTLGYSIGEGFLPLLIGIGIAIVGWRYSMILNALLISIILVPFIWFLLSGFKYNTEPVQVKSQSSNFLQTSLLKDKNFYLIAINSSLLPFLITGFFFYQLVLASEKGWTVEWLTLCFIGFATGRTIFSLVSGNLIDKYTATRLFPYYLTPFALGLSLLIFWDHHYSALCYLTLSGISVGFSTTIKSAVIAEVFGTRNLGSIRSKLATLMVLSTALSPFLFGLLLDSGFSFVFLVILSLFFVLLILILSTRLVISNYTVKLTAN